MEKRGNKESKEEHGQRLDIEICRLLSRKEVKNADSSSMYACCAFFENTPAAEGVFECDIYTRELRWHS